MYVYYMYYSYQTLLALCTEADLHTIEQVRVGCKLYSPYKRECADCGVALGGYRYRKGVIG